jgi:hypothetical protein
MGRGIPTKIIRAISCLLSNDFECFLRVRANSQSKNRFITLKCLLSHSENGPSSRRMNGMGSMFAITAIVTACHRGMPRATPAGIPPLSSNRGRTEIITTASQ